MEHEVSRDHRRIGRAGRRREFAAIACIAVVAGSLGGASQVAAQPSTGLREAPVTTAGALDRAGSEKGRGDLRTGAVFSMSNAPDGNRVVAFDRVGGTYRRVGSFATEGRGSNGFEDTANGLVLGSARGESAPNNLLDDRSLLFATNSGSNSISVFRVRRHRLDLVEVEPSGGEKPVSVTVNQGILYVLNSGEVQDGLPTPPNCTTGHRPSITGFRVSEDGQLTRISGSRRLLSGDPFSGCAQVSFTPSGDHLIATERLAITPGETPNDEGRINTFAVRDDGTLGQQRIVDATGQGPFGFGFTKSGTLLVAEQYDGPDGPGRGGASAYRVRSDGTLERTSGSIRNGGTDTCWFVVTDNGRYGFTASFFRSGRISSYRIGEDGSLRLLQATAAERRVLQGASDLALGRYSRRLYSLNSLTGTIQVYRVNRGDLTFLRELQAHEPSETEARIGLAAS